MIRFLLVAAFLLGIVLALVWVCTQQRYDGVWLLGVLAAVVVIVAAVWGVFDRGARR